MCHLASKLVPYSSRYLTQSRKYSDYTSRTNHIDVYTDIKNVHSSTEYTQNNFSAWRSTGENAEQQQNTVQNSTSGLLGMTPAKRKMANKKEKMSFRKIKSLKCKQSASNAGGVDIGGADKIFQCHLCQRVLANKYTLQSHIEMHNGTLVKPFECEICKKPFRSKHYLNVHELVHGKETPLKCNVCGKGLYRQTGLDIHVRLHTGEKPYQCEICQKRFAMKDYLKGHLLTHTGERPYKCDKCDRTFKWMSHLYEHLRVHSGEKPHKCALCDAAFRRKTHLKRHICVISVRNHLLSVNN